jgi:nucleoside 2-deoxyribosyltransferase
MKVYFGASITLDRSRLPIYQEIAKEIETLGHQITSQHVVDPGLTEGEWQKQYVPKELFKRETDRLDKSDVMIAEVTSPSWGTAFLIEYALNHGKPVLAL